MEFISIEARTTSVMYELRKILSTKYEDNNFKKISNEMELLKAKYTYSPCKVLCNQNGLCFKSIMLILMICLALYTMHILFIKKE